jgi:HAD superfamily hydrolase (TIGR01549 family)
VSRKIGGIVFDLDGTLLNSMPLVLEAFAHATSPFAAAITPDEWRLRMGGPPQRILERALANPVHVEQAMTRLYEYGLNRWREIQAFDGMRAVLSDLQLAGVKLGLWTGRDRESTQHLLQAHGIGEKLSEILCGDDLTTHKPDTEGLTVLLKRLQLEPKDVIFVGDAEVDVLAGASLGVKTLLISHGLIVDTQILAKAWKVVETPPEAYEILRAEGLSA